MTPSESREAALHGHRALTPILSGAISGGIVGVAWIIGIIVWLYKRHRRARRAKAAGYRSYREFLDPPKKQDAFIIPPDPAVLKGQARPGQKFVFEEEKHGSKGKKDFKLKHASTVPIAEGDERPHGEKESVPPGMEHRSSAPTRLPDRAHASSPPASNGGTREVAGQQARHQSNP
ncbi:hypothetical protein K466DRAFT_591402 [Polyporus arcularius HHB13444]|uniref:Uncharacterized protein n=1 Tax=Polyporus arcularius HHB13444 TaxID=1314778 RepID=A0A5C3P5X4_9APHY|nr:hypothetical protein K466DRAFT_591402 [Polyporus arcularius HHB13444]